MKFVPIKEIPTIKKDVVSMLEELERYESKSFKVEFTNADYASSASCQSSLNNIIKKNKLNLKAICKNKTLYIIKTI